MNVTQIIDWNTYRQLFEIWCKICDINPTGETMGADDFVYIGKTDIKVSRIGLGIMQWGVIPLDRYDSRANEEILDIFRTAVDHGINFFDTAEMYGRGKSEIHFGKCIKEYPVDFIIATKYMPFPWRLSKHELRSALSRSLKRLGLSHVDLYQMHWPVPTVPISTWMEAMSEAFSEGLIRAVGVSNYSPAQTRCAHESLAKYKIPLASNQVRYSLLHRRPERCGLVDLCSDLGVTIIAYSPLEKGILTGKYTPVNLPSGNRAWRYNRNYLEKVQPVLDAMRRIGEAHGGKTTGQVALNWLTCKGVIPIPGTRKKAQALENAGGLGWQLSNEEVARLDHISDEVRR